MFPALLSERMHPLNGTAEALSRCDGEFAVYWMRTSVRIHDNPALTAAVVFANNRDLPCFIYHGVSENYPYASDRHHRFILEGARDVAREAEDLGIGYALHVERVGQRPRGLKQMCGRAAAVFVEQRPVDPGFTWTRALADNLDDTPVVAVDSDCIVPMSLPRPGLDRAYKYRNATQPLRQKRLQQDFSPETPDATFFEPEDLFFEPVRIRDADIDELICRCNIDHSVGPVPGRPGGRRAGYERWDTFRQKYLDIYHKLRNNPTRPEAVSRLSPYLHFGHVSPFRIAREASQSRSDGADKFVDELVTWREAAHYYCLNNPDHNSIEGLPNWAKQTLLQHASDKRPKLYSWETLARGETEDELWNLCQKWLLRHGELHNNVRMTWAKKLLEWTESPRRAIDVAIDLNHRYALDGTDPCSYHGILWCFGLFDRPSDSQRDIIGEIRPRDTDWHSSRIDLDKLRAIVDEPTGGQKVSVGIVGAGIAGASAGTALLNHGMEVTVFDKARGPGGRCSTRYSRVDESVQFDHGAQYFTARDPRFTTHLNSWLTDGVVATWAPNVGVYQNGELTGKDSNTDRFVGTPGMNTVARHMLEPAKVEYETKIKSVQKNGDDRWTFETVDDRTLGPFDRAIVTAPPAQTAELIPDNVALSTEMEPTWALLIGFEDRLDCRFDALFANDDGPLAWIARNSSKPGRDGQNWVLHASHTWSKKHLERQESWIAKQLEAAFEHILGDDLPEPTYREVHRWRYAKPNASRTEGALHGDGLVVAGDWLHGGRIEGAFLSGQAASGFILRSLIRD